MLSTYFGSIIYYFIINLSPKTLLVKTIQPDVGLMEAWCPHRQQNLSRAFRGFGVRILLPHAELHISAGTHAEVRARGMSLLHLRMPNI